MTSKELIEATEMLPIELKLQLVDKLLESIVKIENEEVWKKEILKRKADVLNNKVELKSKEEIFNKLRSV
jgi:hypothetical protein